MSSGATRYRGIYAVVARIPKGRVATYGQVAALAGLARRARLVGHALRVLPEDTPCPWHRVVNAQGKISARGRELGHEELQEQLLHREGVRFVAGAISLARYQWKPLGQPRGQPRGQPTAQPGPGRAAAPGSPEGSPETMMAPGPRPRPTRRRALHAGLGVAVAAMASRWRARRALAVAAAGEPPARALVLYVQPLGAALPAADVALVREALVALVGLDVRVMAPVPLPAQAYYPARRRYRADRLLPFLGARLPADGARILGLTAVDISTTKGPYPDWGVLGLGQLPGKASVISSFRCRRSSSGAANARERLAKVAVHELGHTLGLEHCPTPGCLMDDAEGRVATADREYDFCPRCRAQAAAAGHPLPATPKIPWPRP